jgi:hypothetical protein
MARHGIGRLADMGCVGDQTKCGGLARVDLSTSERPLPILDVMVSDALVAGTTNCVTVTVLVDPPQPPAAMAIAAAIAARFGMPRS